MVRQVRIDRAIYVADDRTRTYRFLKRNPAWKNLDWQENERNKKSIEGYTRIFRDGSTRVFKHR